MSGRWSQVLVATAVVAGIFELINAFSIDVPAAAVVFGLLYLSGAAWVARGRGVGGCILVALLNLAELAFLPMYSWSTASDWLVQGGFGVLVLIGLAASVMVIRQRWGLRQRRVAGAQSA